MRRGLHLAHLNHGAGIADIGHDRQPAETGTDFAQQLNPLSDEIPMHGRQAGDIAARPRKAGNQSGADRICPQRKDDRNGGCRLLRRGDGRSVEGDNDVDLHPDQFGSDLGIAIGATVRPAIFDRDGSIFDPSQFA